MPVQTQGERAAPLVAMHPAQVFARSELLQIKVPLPQGYLAQHDPVRVLRFGDFPAAPGADPGSQSIPPGGRVVIGHVSTGLGPSLSRMALNSLSPRRTTTPSGRMNPGTAIDPVVWRWARTASTRAIEQAPLYSSGTTPNGAADRSRPLSRSGLNRANRRLCRSYPRPIPQPYHSP